MGDYHASLNLTTPLLFYCFADIGNCIWSLRACCQTFFTSVVIDAEKSYHGYVPYSRGAEK